MRQFNAPDGWPDPPNARWRPPKNWQPSESWPPAPPGWRFWVDEDGYPVRGPIGRYGGPSVLKLGAAAAVLLVLIGLILSVPFNGDDTASTSADRPVGTAKTPAPAPTQTTTSASPTETPTHEPTHSTTPKLTPTPTPSETTSTAAPPTPTETPTEAPKTTPSVAAAIAYKNCAEVRAAGKAPLHRGDPGYSRDLDRNGDGVACERGNS